CARPDSFYWYFDVW
nr:immunoglobulin heavy chain junction region [Mus musculus]